MWADARREENDAGLPEYLAEYLSIYLPSYVVTLSA